jgi:transposase
MKEVHPCPNPTPELSDLPAGWSKAGAFDRIFQALAADSTTTGTLMIDSTHLKAHRTACLPSRQAGQRLPGGGG